MLHRSEHLYDAANRITQQPSVLGSRIYTSTYTYNDNIASNTGPVKDGSLKQVEFSAPDKTLSFTYDSLKHLSSAAVNGLYTRTYSYRAIDGQRSSNQISGLSYAANNSGLTALSYTYTYDNRGNITQIKQNGSTVAEYTYNGQNQLISEKRGSTYTYTYDTSGNILSREVLGVPGTTKTYSYGASHWKDLLTAYNGHAIYYEGQGGDPANRPVSGNPTNWYNGSTYTNLTWEKGRQLASLKKGTTNISYAYDMNGIRKSKTVGSEQHTYLTQSGQVVRETIGTGSSAVILDFIYDNNGSPFALCYSNNNGATFTDYYYILNMQGDVVRLVNSEGTTAASYTYDAWGKELSASGTMASINPLRYRGYYYDTDTGWYYLQSRYYDPEIGRFINADLPEYSAAFSVDDNNLFAYCENNPIIRYDKYGELSELVVEVAVGALIGGITGAIWGGLNSVASGGSFWKGALIGGASGAISGAASSFGKLVSTAVCAFSSTAAYLVASDNPTFWGGVSAFAIGAINGLVSGTNTIQKVDTIGQAAFSYYSNGLASTLTTAVTSLTDSRNDKKTTTHLPSYSTGGYGRNTQCVYNTASIRRNRNKRNNRRSTYTPRRRNSNRGRMMSR